MIELRRQHHQPQHGQRGEWVGLHPVDGAHVVLKILFTTEWKVYIAVLRALTNNETVVGVQSVIGGKGYLPVTTGEELRVLYVGKEADEKDWIFATSLGCEESGWVHVSVVTKQEIVPDPI